MDDFFTLASVGTLTGSVAAVVVITNTIRHAFNWGPRWFALLLSIAVALIALQISAGLGEESETASLGLLRYLFALINGCLIYTSAFGIQNTVIADQGSGGPPAHQLTERLKLRFNHPW